MPDEMVSIPMSRVVEIGRMLGGQDTSYCPPEHGDLCWLQRAGETRTYLDADGDPITDECSNCFVNFIVTGR